MEHMLPLAALLWLQVHAVFGIPEPAKVGENHGTDVDSYGSPASGLTKRATARSPALLLATVAAVYLAKQRQLLVPLSGRVLSVLLGLGSTDPLVASIAEHQPLPSVSQGE